MWYAVAFIVGAWLGYFIAALMCVSSGKHVKKECESCPLDNTKLM